MNKPQVHQAFDDALPERLLALESGPSASKVHLHVGEAEPSPFIVKLTREGETRALPSAVAAPAVASAAMLEDLSKTLIIDYDDVLDEAPLVIASTHADGLRLSPADLHEQTRELDQVVDPLSIRVRATAAMPEALDEPVDMWSDLEPVDVVEALAVESLPEVPEPLIVSALVTEPVAVPSEVYEPRQVEVYVRHGSGWQRALASFVGLALVAVLPLHAMQVLADVRADGGTVEAESKAALDTFLRGATSLSSEQFGSAGEDFEIAAQGFADAEASLNDLNAGVTALASVIPATDSAVTSAHALVTAGRELSETAAIMSTAAADLSNKESLDLTTKLDLLGTYMENALPHAQAAAAALQEVDPDVVPENYSDSIFELQTRTPQLVVSMEEYVRFVDTLSVILGGDDKMRYLAVFQNNTEMRPTGGFMGSFAEIDVERGEVVRMFVPGGGTYDVQGQLQAFVAAPGPLQLLKARWEFQDANWFPDFPSTAKKLRWFYSEAGGPTSDGVVAVNATFVAELLRLLGPVEMPEYGRTFDAENFVFETQKIVEMEYDTDENTPKEIIGDLAPILLERIKEADTKTLMAVVDLVAKGLAEKDVQLNFRDNDLQADIESLGWSGAIKQTSGDYLMVVNTNLGGGKTDGVIDQAVDVQVDIAESGSVLHTVTITKTHRGMKTALFSGSNNVDYLRLYVPKGSELVSADGFEVPADELFETSDVPLSVDGDLALHMQDLHKDAVSGTDIWEEDGKTVFGNWMQTASGETEVVTFTYRTPLKLFVNEKAEGVMGFARHQLGIPDLGQYTFLVQKQPGVQVRTTDIHVTFPDSVTPLWSSAMNGLSGQVEANNATDTFFGWLVERR